MGCFEGIDVKYTHKMVHRQKLEDENCQALKNGVDIKSELTACIEISGCLVLAIILENLEFIYNLGKPLLLTNSGSPFKLDALQCLSVGGR